MNMFQWCIRYTVIGEYMYQYIFMNEAKIFIKTALEC